MNVLASKAQLRASFLRWSLFCVPLILLIGFVGGRMGTPDTLWFQSLTKPTIFPPPAAFGIVWSILFTMIGFALALVLSAWGAYGRGLAVGLFVPHFLITTAWTLVFFGLQDMQGGLIVLGLAVVSLLPVLWAFFRVRSLAAYLLVPYFGWLCFASALNYQFIVENPDGGVQTQSGAEVEVSL
ncbi:MAG: TspO/MBR family protein [Erythrobacter sp.]|uniref:TspO/MBR family protein n=1 Tax=Erythrobacter sp. TaxID=1042 RepID=UPI00260E69C9|nr:TspO/MBR family protein [Erythrobacter sp.]MDJ0978879.1 TspO/MBR family protein [Erythrobacter sp.]